MQPCCLQLLIPATAVRILTLPTLRADKWDTSCGERSQEDASFLSKGLLAANLFLEQRKALSPWEGNADLNRFACLDPVRCKFVDKGMVADPYTTNQVSSELILIGVVIAVRRARRSSKD